MAELLLTIFKGVEEDKMKLERHGNDFFTGVIGDNKGVTVYVKKTAGDQFEAVIPKAVLDMLEDVFNDDDACIEAWLNKPKRPLGGATPRALLRTKDGVDTVIGMLERMKTGDFS
ncbi:antitoxin Xre/MbcA/ParS toxin-binding domain-containing protein [Shewanella sp. 0m-8]